MSHITRGAAAYFRKQIEAEEAWSLIMLTYKIYEDEIPVVLRQWFKRCSRWRISFLLTRQIALWLDEYCKLTNVPIEFVSINDTFFISIIEKKVTFFIIKSASTIIRLKHTYISTGYQCLLMRLPNYDNVML